MMMEWSSLSSINLYSSLFVNLSLINYNYSMFIFWTSISYNTKQVTPIGIIEVVLLKMIAGSSISSLNPTTPQNKKKLDNGSKVIMTILWNVVLGKHEPVTLAVTMRAPIWITSNADHDEWLITLLVFSKSTSLKPFLTKR